MRIDLLPFLVAQLRLFSRSTRMTGRRRMTLMDRSHARRGLSFPGAAMVCALLMHNPAFAQGTNCGQLTREENPQGIHDYRRLQGGAANALKNVEKFHFPSYVEALTRGETGALGADIGFVLNYFPNHPRALDAMARLAYRDKTPQPRGARFSIDCYFDRAIRFVPDDGRVRMIQGMYLARIGKVEPALAAYKEAERLMPESNNVAYNMGLLYFDVKKYDQSLAYAKKAYEGGLTLPGLKNKLTSAGKWPANLVIVPAAPRLKAPPETPAAVLNDVPASRVAPEPEKAGEGSPPR